MKQGKRDPLEEYILSNRDHFDSDEPSDKIWGRIERKLDHIRRRGRFDYNFLWKAAAILLFGVTVFLLIERNMNMTQERTETATVEEVNPEFREAESYLIQQINEKKEHIRQYQDEYGEVTGEFLRDVEKLDQMYAELKEELKQNKTEHVVDAMIQNLQLRIDILNQQIKILEDINKAEQDEEYRL